MVDIATILFLSVHFYLALILPLAWLFFTVTWQNVDHTYKKFPLT